MVGLGIAVEGRAQRVNSFWNRVGKCARVFLVLQFALAFYPFLVDFVSPLTPTPIAIVSGKTVPAILTITCASLLAQSLLLLVHTTSPRVFELRTLGVEAFTCRWRC